MLPVRHTGDGGTVTLLGLERVSLAGSGGAATLAIVWNGERRYNAVDRRRVNAGGFAVGGNNFSYSAIGGASTVNGGTGSTPWRSRERVPTISSPATATNRHIKRRHNDARQRTRAIEALPTLDGNDNITPTGPDAADYCRAPAQETIQSVAPGSPWR